MTSLLGLAVGFSALVIIFLFMIRRYGRLTTAEVNAIDIYKDKSSNIKEKLDSYNLGNTNIVVLSDENFKDFQSYLFGLLEDMYFDEQEVIRKNIYNMNYNDEPNQSDSDYVNKILRDAGVKNRIILDEKEKYLI